MIIINGDTLSSISKIKKQNVHSTVAPLILSVVQVGCKTKFWEDRVALYHAKCSFPFRDTLSLMGKREKT